MTNKRKGTNLKKAISLALCACSALSVFAWSGCGGGGGGDSQRPPETIDTNKTQLYVGNYDGGIGEDWLYEAKSRYEALHSDVQVIIDTKKNEYLTTKLETTIATDRQDLYFLDSVDYDKYVKNGLIMDVTDLVKDGGTSSIENRMNASLRSYYKTSDEKYYGVPFYNAFFQMVYDVDLFDDYKLWLNAAGTGFVTSLEEDRYIPAGSKKGAWDYGLPYTYSQFFMLLEQMTGYGIMPITYSGAKASDYMEKFIQSVIADYMGDEFSTLYSLDGTIKTITNTDFTDSEVGTFNISKTDPTVTNPSNIQYGTATITAENAVANLPMAAGKYYALKFAHDVVGNGQKYVNREVVNSPSETHLGAQDTFLYSAESNTRIAMLIDGGWWLNEASVSMNDMAIECGDQYSMENRRFGVMPIPKADDGSSASGRTFAASSGSSALVINSHTSKPDLAKDFFTFINSEEEMVYFTLNSNNYRPFKYTLTEEQKNQVPYFTRIVGEVVDSCNIEYTLPRKDNLKVYYTLMSASWNLQSIVSYEGSNKIFKTPLVSFFEYPNVSAKEYFLGLKTASTDNFGSYDFT